MDYRLTVILTLLVVSACTKPPQMPELPQREPHPIKKVILDDTLDAKDIRAIFNVLNRNGKLSSLERFFQKVSDADIERFATLVSDTLYEEALHKEGLVSLLSERIEKRDFSALHDTVQRWIREEPHLAATLDLFFYLATTENFPILLARDVGVLDPRWTGLIQRLRERTRAAFPETIVQSLSPDAVLTDLQTFIQSHMNDRLVALVSQLEDQYAGTSTLLALSQLRKRFGPHPTAPFEGFALGLGRLLLKPPIEGRDDGIHHNQLDLLLHFVHTANRPSQGIFRTVQNRIQQDPGLIGNPAELAQAVILRGVSGFIQEKLSNPSYNKRFWLSVASDSFPTPEFVLLFREIENAIQLITGFPKPQDLLAKMPVYLNAIIVANWFSSQIRHNIEVFQKLPEEKFNTALWKQSMRAHPFQAQITRSGDQFFLHVDNQKFPVNLDTQMARIGGGAQHFLAQLKKSFWGGFVYTLGSTPEQKTLSDTLLSVVTDCDRTLSFANGRSFVRAFGFLFTRPHLDTTFFHLEDFETDNMMTGMNRLILNTSYEDYSRIEGLLFDDLEIGNLSFDNERFVLDFFEETPGLQNVVKNLLNSAHALYEFNRPHQAGLPSGLQTYFTLLSHIGKEEMPWVGSLLSYLCEGRFLSSIPKERKNGEMEWLAAYPAIHHWVARGRILSRLFYGLSWIEPHERHLFLKPIRESLGGARIPGDGKNSGLMLHLQMLDELLKAKPSGLRALIDLLQRRGGSIVSSIDEANARERRWILRFIENNDHEFLIRFFSKHGDRKAFIDWTDELKQSLEDGSLRQMAEILSYIDNDRMRRVARVLTDWIESGELGHLLLTVRQILKVAHLPWEAPPFVAVGRHEPMIKESLLAGDPGEEHASTFHPIIKDSEEEQSALLRSVLGHPRLEEDLPRYFAISADTPIDELKTTVDPEMGGGERNTLECLKKHWEMFWESRKRKIENRWEDFDPTPSCLYSRQLLPEGMKDPKSARYPCLTKVLKFQERDHENFVIADGSCFLEGTSLLRLQVMVEDVDHYVQIPADFDKQAAKDAAGIPILKDGFRFLEAYQALDENYQVLAPEHRLGYPTLVYGLFRMKYFGLNIRSPYLIDVWPVGKLGKIAATTATQSDPALNASKEYALRWSGHKKSVEQVPHLGPQGLSLTERLAVKPIHQQYGSWYFKDVPGGIYARYYLAELLSKSVTGVAPEIVLHAKDGMPTLSLKESMYAKLARQAHQEVLLGLVQRALRERFLATPYRSP